MVFWCFVSVFRCFTVSWFSNAMTDGSAFFIAIVKFSKYSHNCSNGMGIFMCMLNSSTLPKGNCRNSTVFTLNLMSDTPKKSGKKRSRKPKQMEASDFAGFAE